MTEEELKGKIAETIGKYLLHSYRAQLLIADQIITLCGHGKCRNGTGIDWEKGE